MIQGMKSRRVTAPDPEAGILYRASNVTGEIYESTDVVAIIRRTLVVMTPTDKWTFERLESVL